MITVTAAGLHPADVLAVARDAAPAAPPGAPDGRLPPPGNPDRGAPVPCPPARPAAPHAPLTGGVTLSVAAVNVVAEVELPLGPVANTQSPALTALSVVDTVSVNDVAVLHETATWPFCWLWTCIVEPETAAMRPDAAGAFAPPAGPAAPAAAPPAGAADVCEVPLPDDPPPQAARATTVRARPVASSIEPERGVMDRCIRVRPSCLGWKRLVIRCAARRSATAERPVPRGTPRSRRR